MRLFNVWATEVPQERYLTSPKPQRGVIKLRQVMPAPYPLNIKHGENLHGEQNFVAAQPVEIFEIEAGDVIPPIDMNT